MGLTDNLRAAVFARDKAICSFSGLSLWLLDYRTAPFAQPDWADHIKPVSRGGNDTLENLVCASFFYNSKKTNNGSDTAYLFRDGQPTEIFFWNHGYLSTEQAVIMRRHAKLCETDWYFNRAIYNLSCAMHDNWLRSASVRTPEYWQRSAYKRLAIWRQKATPKERGFLKRSLVRFPDAPDVQLLLELADADFPQLQKIYKKRCRYYNANANVLDAFAGTSDAQRRTQIIRHAGDRGLVTEPLLHSLHANLNLLRPSAGNLKSINRLSHGRTGRMAASTVG
jgi:hypothetical protein